jgi:ADP-ribose diphosphatase
MMAGLSDHQANALDAYEALIAVRPALFTGRRRRPIVQDRQALADYASKTGTVLGLAAETPYFLFIVDLVESQAPDGSVHRHPYSRVVSRKQLEGGVNVVILATIQSSALGKLGDIVLLEQERHALGTREFELPRGFGEAGISGEANALRELEEETGYIGDHARLLTTTSTDSGLTDALASFYHVPVARRAMAKPETGEAIGKVRLFTAVEIWHDVQAGRIRDGFTLQALAMYEKLRF